jgi:hypothetical protein
MSFTDNWSEIVAVLGALHIIALAVVNVTPTPKDNEIYGKVYKIVEKLAGIIHPNVKQR